MRRISSSLLLLFLAAGCSTARFQAAPARDAAVAESQFFGQRVQIWEAEEGDIYQHEVAAPPSAAALRLEESSFDWDDVFEGTARKKSKISIADGPIEHFDSLDEFLESVPSDGEMMDRDISNSADSGRTQTERRNVRFPAFMFATNKPADNDYHVIVGNDAEDPTLLMNVEISGLPLFPRDDDFSTLEDADRLRRVREFFQDSLGDELPTGGGYKRFFPGVPVTVTGSILYDTSHPPGQVGPGGLRPETSWEVHPVTFVQFSPEDN